MARGANVDCTLGHLPSGPENIVYRILERFKEAARVSQGARVRLIKRIPSAAGLGGASSDAAAALWAANRAWQVGWPAARLAEFAAESGSDIPFFLAARGDEPLALCQGRGEQIRGVKLPVSLPVVVARPAVGLSTPQVYQACRAAPSPRPVQPMIEALRGGDIRSVGSLLFNRLEFAASRFTPWIGRLRSWFQHRDVVGFGMSGSGSSCFAICRHGGQSQRIAGQLRAEGLAEVFCARTVARHCQVVTTGAVPQDSS